MVLLLTAAAWSILRTRESRPLPTELALVENLLPRFREAEIFSTTTRASLGARRFAALSTGPDRRRGPEATGLLAFPDGTPPYGWFVGRRAGFQLDVLERRDRTLTVRLLDGLDSDPPQSARLLFNGRELAEAVLEPGAKPTRLTAEVPAALQRRGPNQVELIFARTESRTLSAEPVPLPLAALVTGVTFLAEGESADDDPGRPERFGIVSSEGDDGGRRAELVLPADSCARLGLALPDLERVVLRLVVERLDTPLDVSLQLDSRERVQLQRLDPGTNGPARVDLDLTPWAGQRVALELWARAADSEGAGAPADEAPPARTGARTAAAGEALLRGVLLLGPDEPAPQPVSPPRPRPEPRPSFLVVVLDALERSRVGLYGEREPSLTPVLDALGARGVVVDRMLAPASYTLASVGALLTGQNPLTHGVVHLRDAGGFQRLADTTPRLAAALNTAGWRTFALVTNPNAGAAHGYDAGFDDYVELFDDPALWRDGVAGVHLAPRLADFLADAGEQPFLAYVHVFEPHAPYDAPPELLERHVPPYEGPVRGDREWLDAFKRGEAAVDAAGWEHLRALYAARVALADRVLGELLDALAESGRAEDTVVVVTSDHGEAFGEHGWLEHGDQVHGEQLNVPLVLAGPGLGPARLPGPATLEDVAPTLLRHAGVSVPPDMQGRDLLAGGTSPRALHARSAAALPVLAITRWPWRLQVDTQTGRVRLYDLARDPGERTDLAPVHPATTLWLQQELTAAHLDASQAAGAERVATDDAEAAERLAQLAALGYAGGEPPAHAPPADDDGLSPAARTLIGLLRRL